MGPTPFTELGPKKTQNADFAMKQRNIYRLSGDIKSNLPNTAGGAKLYEEGRGVSGAVC